MTSVSVIIPTHDRRARLAGALDSVRAQTLAPLEVIVVDDGSTDDTADWLGERYGDVRLIRQAQRGVSAARNRGIRAACGQWLAFLDSDDTWHPGKLASQIEALGGNPDHRVCHTDEIWIRNGRRVNPRRRHAKHGGWIFRQCLPLCAISPSAVVIHRSVFSRVGLFDESLPACEDYDLWLRISACYPVLLVDRPLVTKHGGHGDQLSRRYHGLDRFRVRALEKILEAGAVSGDDRRAAAAMLVEKAGIFAAGAAKRGDRARADRYRATAQRWSRVAGTV